MHRYVLYVFLSATAADVLIHFRLHLPSPTRPSPLLLRPPHRTAPRPRAVPSYLSICSSSACPFWEAVLHTTPHRAHTPTAHIGPRRTSHAQTANAPRSLAHRPPRPTREHTQRTRTPAPAGPHRIPHPHPAQTRTRQSSANAPASDARFARIQKTAAGAALSGADGWPFHLASPSFLHRVRDVGRARVLQACRRTMGSPVGSGVQMAARWTAPKRSGGAVAPVAAGTLSWRVCLVSREETTSALRACLSAPAAPAVFVLGSRGSRTRCMRRSGARFCARARCAGRRDRRRPACCSAAST